MCAGVTIILAMIGQLYGVVVAHAKALATEQKKKAIEALTEKKKPDVNPDVEANEDHKKKSNKNNVQ